MTVTVNGVAVEPAYDGHRIPLTGLRTDGQNKVVVEARLPYVTDGDGMHTFTDPADGERYVSAYVGVDITQRVFACFDQVDLKAPITCGWWPTPAWTVLSNGEASAAKDTERARGGSTPTPPIPIDLFVLCAGPWHSRTFEHAGLPMGWHARRSLAAELDRDFDELRRITEQCFDHYAELFDEPFPFDTYDQVLVPELNWGAMENPGCVTFRDELLPRGRVTEVERQTRAMVIAHEMSHMWFGDLVTQTWWEDIWLNESFAEYMGFRVSEEAAGFAGSLGRLPGHPQAERDGRRPAPVDAPGRAAARGRARRGHRVHQLRRDLLREGRLRAAPARHLDGRRGLPGRGERPPHEAPVRQRHPRGPGRARWTRRRRGRSGRGRRCGCGSRVTTPSGSSATATCRCWSATASGRTGSSSRRTTTGWPSSTAGSWTSRPSPVRLEDWAGRVVVPNPHGETFARVQLDERSWSAVEDGLGALEDDLARSVLWATAMDAVAGRDLAAERYLALVDRHLPAERHVSLITAVADATLGQVLSTRVPAAAAVAVHERVAAACRAGLDAGGDPVAFTRGLAGSSRDADELRRWLADDRTDHDVALDPQLRWRVVHRLAGLGGLDAAGDRGGAPPRRHGGRRPRRRHRARLPAHRRGQGRGVGRADGGRHLEPSLQRRRRRAVAGRAGRARRAVPPPLPRGRAALGRPRARRSRRSSAGPSRRSTSTTRSSTCWRGAGRRRADGAAAAVAGRPG